MWLVWSLSENITDSESAYDAGRKIPLLVFGPQLDPLPLCVHACAPVCFVHSPMSSNFNI